jgi:HAD superfamily hydrolase (TIGR01484 family)
MRPKIFIADVDDTICESTKVIKKEMVNQLVALNETGTTLIFISGSTIDQIYWQISPFLKTTHYLIGTSGSECVGVNRYGIKSKIFEVEFPYDDKKKVLEAFEDLIVCHLVFPVTTKEDQLQDRGSQVTFSCLGRNAPSDMKKKFDPNRIIRTRWVRFLIDRLGSLADKYSINIGGTTSIDVTIKGIDKAYGISRLLAIIKESPSDAIFFGDSTDPGGNDYPATNVITIEHIKRILND